MLAVGSKSADTHQPLEMLALSLLEQLVLAFLPSFVQKDSFQRELVKLCVCRKVEEPWSDTGTPELKTKPPEQPDSDTDLQDVVVTAAAADAAAAEEEARHTLDSAGSRLLNTYAFAARTVVDSAEGIAAAAAAAAAT